MASENLTPSPDLPSVIQLTLNGEEFMALFSCALAFVLEHHPQASPEERSDGAQRAAFALSVLAGDTPPNGWDVLMLRAIRLAGTAWPGRFSFEIGSGT